ncbi:ABC transporter permease [Nonomuraea sp. NPDC050556]|uniref:ABC transporter permease n=1 Tax=Nonomuraea sp. NPDC050556 TaxID=3364369 RepID=UPI0037A91FDD
MGGILLAEWTKTRSVRSTYWTVITAVVVTIGLSAMLVGLVVAAAGAASATERTMMLSQVEAVSFSTSGLTFGSIAVVVFGVLMITSEYGTGQIRSTIAAVPNRSLLIAAKAGSVGLVSLAVGVVGSFASFFVGQALLAGEGLQTTIGAPGVFWAVARGALMVALLGLLALAVGALLRSSAGAITIMIALLFVPAILAAFVPAWVRDHVIAYLPTSAASVMVYPADAAPTTEVLSPTQATLVLAGWVVALLVAAAVVTERRDV